MEAELEGFDRLSDDVLWLLANSTLSVAQQEALASLNEFSQQRDLTLTEEQHQETLLSAYERMIVRRAQATGVLKARGYSVSGLTNKTLFTPAGDGGECRRRLPGSRSRQ